MTRTTIKIAVAQYEIEHLQTWQAYEDKILRMVEQAKAKDTDLLCMSEYAGLELASWTQGKLLQQFKYIQTRLQEYEALFSSLASKYQLHIQPGTIPVLSHDHYYRNRAYLFSPNGMMSYQDKIHLTPFELNTTLIHAGTELRMFDTSLGKIGIATCYDAEFPTLVHQLIKAGANLILSPSCTEKISGLTRVVTSARARAIENQCYVAQSCLIGNATWCEMIDINTGLSGVYSPADTGFPEDGILAQAQINTAMLIYADLSWDKLSHVRAHGEMRNFNDMQSQASQLLHTVNLVNLT